MISNKKKQLCIKLLQPRLGLTRGTPGSMDRFTMFSTLNGMAMNVSDMTNPYSHYPPHYTYQVRFAVQFSIPFGNLKCFNDFLICS